MGRRRTHPLFLTKIGYERLSEIDGEVLEKADIVTPEQRPTNKTERRTNVSFPPRAMPAEKQGSVLVEGNTLTVSSLLGNQGVPAFWPFTRHS